MYKLKIAAIYELDGVTPKLSHQYRVGQIGTMDRLHEGCRMCFKYEDGHGMLITSPIVEYAEYEYGDGVKVTTINSIYVLEEYHEPAANMDDTIIMKSI